MEMRSSFQVVFSIFSLFSILISPGLVSSHDECKVKKCGNGPSIRFPFRLKGQQPNQCGYPGFELSCNEKKKTQIELPSGKFFVERIDYKLQVLHLYDPDGCLINLLHINTSATPFEGNYEFYSYTNEIPSTLFNCSSSAIKGSNYRISCPSVTGFNIYVVEADDFDYGRMPLSSCTKIETIRSRFDTWELYTYRYISLRWSMRNCTFCEAKGLKCGLNNGTRSEIGCSKFPVSSTKRVVTGVTLGSIFLLVAVVIISIKVYHTYTIDKTERENQIKIEKFLEDYISLKPSRYTYADIKTITNQFKEKLGEGGYGSVFKGKLSNEILVAVKVLNNLKGNGEEFINEVGTIGRIHHVNVVRLVGYCADGCRRALVYEFLPNESLEKFIFLRDSKKPSLSWEKLQDIAIGTAKGIEYLHQGCDQRILHFDIKPHNILLDENFNPKVSDFGLAKLCSKDISIVSMTAARGTMGYIAPEVLSRNFGNASYKSDVYSFGMLLLEMVGGRKNIDATMENTSQVYFPEWVYDRVSQGNELGIRIEEEEEGKIAKKLTIVGLWCIQWYPMDRPTMKSVVQMLEGSTENVIVPPNPFVSSTSSNTNVGIANRPRHRELAVISELE